MYGTMTIKYYEPVGAGLYLRMKAAAERGGEKLQRFLRKFKSKGLTTREFRAAADLTLKYNF